ncbi:MAG TPA: hypothetical protein VGH36_14290 [Acetobacteraceae bacterium]
MARKTDPASPIGSAPLVSLRGIRKRFATGYADPGVKQWLTPTFRGAVIPGA